ncbi:hypothetical protein H696_00719 [Fonticula alba]|uniref:Uncharacterized protein n=1 Tax=Fonticula alba TaxID=691883 RepID=A0A058ZGT3_FONAL|nr:hypothetical protein H696_00719 [Fonticula alba]KCV73176.1 hypothetical protein H696_00719 [Fonticula alba]|eukprot:XP_009492877.1 hypothetical protein H696_00719 [Fonticula alba]
MADSHAVATSLVVEEISRLVFANVTRRLVPPLASKFLRNFTLAPPAISTPAPPAPSTPSVPPAKAPSGPTQIAILGVEPPRPSF